MHDPDAEILYLVPSALGEVMNEEETNKTGSYYISGTKENDFKCIEKRRKQSAKGGS